MKRHLRFFLFFFISLWILPNIVSSVVFEEGIKTIAEAALALTLINTLIKPLINLLLLPVNLLTLGMFRWIVNAVVLYLATLFVPHFKINAFLFPGLTYKGFVVPSINFGLIGTFILVSFIISFITTFLAWLTK